MMTITKDNKHYMTVAHLTGQRSYAKEPKLVLLLLKTEALYQKAIMAHIRVMKMFVKMKMV